MANFKFIASGAFALFVSLSAFSPFAQAGYASARPPPGWQPGGVPAYKPAPGEFYDLDKKAWMTMASVNLGGRELTVPVKMPLATAVDVGLTVASAFSANPAILLGTLAWGLYQTYLSQKRITPGVDGTFTQVQDGIMCQSDCFEYETRLGTWTANAQTAAESHVFKPAYCPPGTTYVIAVKNLTPSGSYTVVRTTYGYPGTTEGVVALNKRPIPPYNYSTTKEITADTVSQEMSTAPIPYPPPAVLVASGVPVPVGTPVLNPNASGSPSVIRLPQGSPVAVPLPNPNPNNLPQTWKTPVTDLLPSPIPSDPWRFEVIPKDIIKTSVVPLPDPTNPQPGDSLQPTDPADPNTPTEAPVTPDLCEKNPEIAACATLDVPKEDKWDITNKDFSMNPDSGWGASDAACPEPRHITVQGRDIPIPFDLFCQYMHGIRPLVIAMAWLSAAFIMLGAKGGD